MSNCSRETIKIRNELAQIERVTAWLSQIARCREWDDQFIYHVQLSVEEILTNIVKYAYSDAGEHLIWLEAHFSDDRIELLIVDDGRAVNPLQLPPPNLSLGVEERPVGGLGVHIVRSVMDTVSYERRGRYNQLWLKKKTATQAK
ncbi:MAG: ATP-binding protein [Negativicutes bacterium]|nr:ATP-binding protein [Negativicutes bacterium]